MADLTGMMQAAAGAAGGGFLVQEVFSVDLYTGNSSTQTITNGIDLDGEGGLVWIKNRASITNHTLFDTERGVEQAIKSSTTAADAFLVNSVDGFTSTGFTLGSNVETNVSPDTYVSWAFRKAPNFFDVVTYTGNDTPGRTVSHNLGSVPGCIIVKKTSSTGDWQVYHRANTANPETDYLVLNDTAATADSNTRWNDTAPTSTVFSLGNGTDVNGAGNTYVAYLFAHDAGGFGSGSANVISCGSVTTDAGGSATVTLGYEPQWILGKRTDDLSQWFIFDTTRTWAPTNTRYLQPNNSNAEGNYGATDVGSPNATGFTLESFGDSFSYIYIAIRADM
jgi:hypothetical protein